jgi:hypothetical protein
MFESTVALVDEYYRLVDARGDAGFVRELGVEAHERLQQLDFILDRVRDLEQTSKNALERPQAHLKAHIQRLKEQKIDFESVPAPENSKITREEFEAHNRAEFEMKLLTESFYYLAGRLRTIIKHKSAPLPGLQSFETAGVRNVRNKLLEHAESKDSQVLIQSFGHGGECGPVIKAMRYSDQKDVFPDRGLYINAQELKDNLEAKITDVLARA